MNHYRPSSFAEPVPLRRTGSLRPQVAGDDKAQILQHSIGSRPLTEQLDSDEPRCCGWGDEAMTDTNQGLGDVDFLQFFYRFLAYDVGILWFFL